MERKWLAFDREGTKAICGEKSVAWTMEGDEEEELKAMRIECGIISI